MVKKKKKLQRKTNKQKKQLTQHLVIPFVRNKNETKELHGDKYSVSVNNDLKLLFTFFPVKKNVNVDHQISSVTSWCISQYI